jgi:hypothetical protein
MRGDKGGTPWIGGIMEWPNNGMPDCGVME